MAVDKIPLTLYAGIPTMIQEGSDPIVLFSEDYVAGNKMLELLPLTVVGFSRYRKMSLKLLGTLSPMKAVESLANGTLVCDRETAEKLEKMVRKIMSEVVYAVDGMVSTLCQLDVGSKGKGEVTRGASKSKDKDSSKDSSKDSHKMTLHLARTGEGSEIIFVPCAPFFPSGLARLSGTTSIHLMTMFHKLIGAAVSRTGNAYYHYVDMTLGLMGGTKIVVGELSSDDGENPYVRVIKSYAMALKGIDEKVSIEPPLESYGHSVDDISVIAYLSNIDKIKRALSLIAENITDVVCMIGCDKASDYDSIVLVLKG
jgi:hypothetical protein